MRPRASKLRSNGPRSSHKQAELRQEENRRSVVGGLGANVGLSAHFFLLEQISSIALIAHSRRDAGGLTFGDSKNDMLKDSLLAAALTFQSWYGDVEQSDARNQRLEVIAEAIDRASARAVCANAAADTPCTVLWRGDRVQLAFLLLAQAYFETRLALHVHQGNCRSHLGECDSGRAISLWQLQAGPHLPKEQWEMLAGTDLAATTRAATEAARALSRGKNYCGTLSGAISLYATGRTCRWEEAPRRVNYVQHLMVKYPVARASRQAE